jgi:hypothetical protein
LLIASQFKEPLTYLEEHEDQIARASTREFQKMVAQEKRQSRVGMKKDSRSDTIHDLGYRGVRVIQTWNGKSLTIQGLNKGLQEDIINALNALFSQLKE